MVPEPPTAAANTRIDLSQVQAGRDIHIHAVERLTEEDARERRNRRNMLAKVRHDWIEGILEPSLYNLARIELGLETNPAAVTRPFDLLVQRPDAPPQPLPPGTSINQVFEASGYGLLILGAPGAGKTTLLLELTRDLLDRAEQDAIALIPVVFNLSSWARQQLPLEEWLIDELRKRYHIGPKLSRAWVTEERILPLLDGLDEVALQQREACVAAINAFIQDHGLKLPPVVCSRVADYQALSTQLELPSAVRVQPLARDQVSEYLEQAGTKLAGVRAALHEDPTLWELLDTPLMLSVVSLAFQGRPVEAVRSTGTLEERRSHLFAAYVDAMFKRRGVGKYLREKTERWLSWLAGALQRHDQSELFLERMQPDWLPTPHQQQRVTLTTAILAALLFGLLFGLPFGLIAGLGEGLIGGLGEGLIGRLGEGLIGGLGVGLGVGLSAGLLGGLIVSLKSSLAGGLIFGLIEGLREGLREGLGGGLIEGLREGLGVGLSAGLLAGLSIRLVGYSKSIQPLGRLGWSWPEVRRNWVRKSLYRVRMGLLIGLPLGLIGGLYEGLHIGLIEGLSVGLRKGLHEGLPNGLLVGLRAWVLVWLIGGLFYGLILGLGFGLIFGLIFGLSGAVVLGIRDGLTEGTIEIRSVPNQEIKWSALNAVISGLGFGLIAGLLVGLIGGLIGGLGFGLIVGLSFGLRYGGRACLQHYALRLVLWRNDYAPLNYVRFLDYAAERIFLRKVGGGYVFVHRTLLDYFATLFKADPRAR